MKSVISTARFTCFPSKNKFIFDDKPEFPNGEILDYTRLFSDWVKESLKSGNLKFYKELSGSGYDFFVLSIEDDFYRGVIQISLLAENDKRIGNSTEAENGETGFEQPLKRTETKRVLLVEDNDMNKKVVESILAKLELQLEHASNGEEALEMISQNDYDLILMDISMPVMDGYEATRRLRSTFPNSKNRTPVIALTAALRAESETKIVESGMNGYIGKPIVSKELIQAVESYLFEEYLPGHRVTEPDNDDIFVVNELLDLTYLKEVSNNDLVFAADIVKSFLVTASPLLADLEIAFKKDDIKKSRELCHKFQPVLSYMGLKKIIPLMEKFHLNLQKEDSNKHGQLLILEKIIKMTVDATSKLELIRRKMIEKIG